jgi:hypothetical protein
LKAAKQQSSKAAIAHFVPSLRRQDSRSRALTTFYILARAAPTLAGPLLCAPGKSSLDFAVALQQFEPGRRDKKKAPSKEKPAAL